MQRPPTHAGTRLAGVPPPVRLRLRLRGRVKAVGAYPGLQRWLLVRGTVLLVAFGVLYVLNGLAIGWKNSYDVTIGITSPGDARVAVPALAWPLSIAGWVAAPAVFGAVAGSVISAAITERRQQPAREALRKARERA